MIDLHTHSLLSDGELLPSELVRRAEVIGYRAIAITDHSDASNIDFVIERIVNVCNELKAAIPVIPGVELTHIPPRQIGQMVKRARDLGARLVLVHGETVVEACKSGDKQGSHRGRGGYPGASGPPDSRRCNACG